MSGHACDECLRRSALIGFLGARLSAVLGGADRRLGGVLALDEDSLIAAVAGRHAERAHRFCAGFEAELTRRSLGEAGLAAACRHGGSYPGGLLALADTPPVVYFTGPRERLDRLLGRPVATIVGPRSPSRYALEVAQDLGRGLAVAGVTVVSGLALGVDAAVHRGALEAGGEPLAVLAGGADVPYPRTNRVLYERVRRHGVVISELPPGHRPLRWSFPARNRIMAALARLTVVVEAAEGSGTLITADFATQLGHEVGAVPGYVTSRMAAGSNRLLRDGAAVIRSAEDVLDELYGVTSPGRLVGPAPPGCSRADAPRGAAIGPGPEAAIGSGPEAAIGSGPDAEAEAEPLAAVVARGRPSTRAGGPGRSGQPPAPELEPALRRVLDLVEAEETIDSIGRRAGLSPGAARAALGRLELLGLIARDGLAGYARTLG